MLTKSQEWNKEELSSYPYLREKDDGHQTGGVCVCLCMGEGEEEGGRVFIMYTVYCKLSSCPYPTEKDDGCQSRHITVS